MKKYLLLLIGITALSACAKAYPVYDTQIQTVKPPQFLLEPLPIPQFTGKTNEDLLLYTLTLEENLTLCNVRLSALKKSVE